VEGKKMNTEENEMNRELYTKPTKAHKEAVADLVVNRMMDGVRFSDLESGLACLFGKNDEADVFSLALQKGGLKCPMMACVVGAALVGNEEYNLTFLSEKK